MPRRLVGAPPDAGACHASVPLDPTTVPINPVTLTAASYNQDVVASATDAQTGPYGTTTSSTFTVTVTR